MMVTARKEPGRQWLGDGDGPLAAGGLVHRKQSRWHIPDTIFRDTKQQLAGSISRPPLGQSGTGFARRLRAPHLRCAAGAVPRATRTCGSGWGLLPGRRPAWQRGPLQLLRAIPAEFRTENCAGPLPW